MEILLQKYCAIANNSCLDVCGFFMRDEPQYTPPADLDAFLASGPPPLYVGFGSIVIENPQRLTETILEATRRCGVRVIISRGWSKLGGDSPNTDQVFFLGDCPHGKPFLSGTTSFISLMQDRVAFQESVSCGASWRCRHNRLRADQCTSDYHRAILWRVCLY
jgi:hypothetical protein